VAEIHRQSDAAQLLAAVSSVPHIGRRTRYGRDRKEEGMDLEEGGERDSSSDDEDEGEDEGEDDDDDDHPTGRRNGPSHYHQRRQQGRNQDAAMDNTNSTTGGGDGDLQLHRYKCATSGCNRMANQQCANNQCKEHCRQFQIEVPDEALPCTTRGHAVSSFDSASLDGGEVFAATEGITVSSGETAGCEEKGCKKKANQACTHRRCLSHCQARQARGMPCEYRKHLVAAAAASSHQPRRR